MSRSKNNKAIKMHYLSAEERPLFGPYNSVHATAKDKARSRRAQKLELKRMMYDNF